MNAIGFSLGNKNTEGIAISTYNVQECVTDVEAENMTTRYIQVIQEKRYDPIVLRRCKILRSSLVYRCGAFIM